MYSYLIAQKRATISGILLYILARYAQKRATILANQLSIFIRFGLIGIKRNKTY